MIVKKFPDNLERLLLQMKRADPALNISRLDAIADVFLGVSYTKSDLAGHGSQLGRHYGLLRVGDIDEGRLMRPSLLLSEHASEKIDDKYFVRSGDVLLSARGTIGKIGVVNARFPSAVASRGLAIVRPNDYVWSGFLAALLSSESYQEWLRGHVRGTTIQQLSIKALGLLEIPVPSLSLQTHVAATSLKERRDPLSVLLTELVKEGEDPIALWIDSLGSRLSLENFEDRGFHSARHHWLQRIASEIYDLWQQVQSGAIEAGSNERLQWLTRMEWATQPLRDLIDSPFEEMGEMVLLQEARFRAMGAIMGSSMPGLSCLKEANQFSRTFIEEIDVLIKEKQNQVYFSDFLHPSWIEAEQDADVTLEIINLCSLDVQHIQITTEPDIGTAKRRHLEQGGSIIIHLSIPNTIHVGNYQFTAHIKCETLFGNSVSEELLVSLEVRPPKTVDLNGDFGTSPYIVGSPIDRKEMFFGRQGIIDRIRRQLSTEHRANVILLEGNRRTGKTSILQHLREEGVLPGWVVVNSSFQGAQGHENQAGIPTREVFRHIAKDVGTELDRAGFHPWPSEAEPYDSQRPFRTQFVRALRKAFDNERPFETLELYLQQALEMVQPRRLLLMLDEFDKLQEGIDAGITSPQVPENIRYLLHTYPEISAILTGSRRLKRLREEYWSALFGFGYRMPVEPLELEEAQKLVEQPVSGRIEYLSKARDLVVEWCARQPFLIQSLCNRIFEHAVLSGERRITVNAVERAAEEMIEDNEHFRTLWNYAGTWRKRLILALCDQLNDSKRDEVTLKDLQGALRETPHVPIPRGEMLGDDLDELIELELLDRDVDRKKKTYRLTVPLMSRWIKEHCDIVDVRNRAIREAEEKI